jgi:hypothetical protein
LRIEKIAGDTLGNARRWQEIGDLFDKQNSRCVYTNRLLILGVDASLDHRVAIANGGTHENSNLQWTQQESTI